MVRGVPIRDVGSRVLHVLSRADIACKRRRAHNGGLIDLRELRRHVVRRRGSAADPVSTDDIVQVQSILEGLHRPQTAAPVLWIITHGARRPMECF
jgi:hypothetical protein